MKEATKTVYSCGFCNRKMFVKNACLRHETVCAKNPLNFIMCNGCVNCVEVRKDKLKIISKRLVVDDYLRGLLMDDIDLNELIK